MEQPITLAELETEVFREDVKTQFWKCKVSFSFIVILQALTMLILLNGNTTERVNNMFAVTEINPTKTDVTFIRDILGSLSKADKAYIDRKKAFIFSKGNASNKNTLDIGKALFDIKVKLNNGEIEGKSVNFETYAETELHIKKSTAYGMIQTWEVWQDYDITSLPKPISISALGKLSCDDLEELRAHVFGIAAKGEAVSVVMANNAIELYRNGLACRKITAAAMKDPSKYLTCDEETPEQDSPQDTDMSFKCGNNIEVKLICHCEEKPNDDAMIEALQDAINKITSGEIDN